MFCFALGPFKSLHVYNVYLDTSTSFRMSFSLLRLKTWSCICPWMLLHLPLILHPPLDTASVDGFCIRPLDPGFSPRSCICPRVLHPFPDSYLSVCNNKNLSQIACCANVGKWGCRWLITDNWEGCATLDQHYTDIRQIIVALV